MSLYWDFEHSLGMGVLAAFLVSLFAGLGGALVFIKRRYTKKTINFMLNIAAGIMLASAFFTLLMPAVRSSYDFDWNQNLFSLLITFSVLIGFLLVWSIHAVLPHDHNVRKKHVVDMDARVSWLFVFAIAIHKLPEGLSLGVAYMAGEYFDPSALFMGIALQNIPEGLMVAVSLLAVGYSRLKSVFVAILTGLVQPAGAAVGIVATNVSQMFVPFGMAVAGGCMLFVIINEVLPETYSAKQEDKSSWAVFFGFLVMVFISVSLG